MSLSGKVPLWVMLATGFEKQFTGHLRRCWTQYGKLKKWHQWRQLIRSHIKDFIHIFHICTISTPKDLYTHFNVLKLVELHLSLRSCSNFSTSNKPEDWINSLTTRRLTSSLHGALTWARGYHWTERVLNGGGTAGVILCHAPLYLLSTTPEKDQNRQRNSTMWEFLLVLPCLWRSAPSPIFKYPPPLKQALSCFKTAGRSSFSEEIVDLRATNFSCGWRHTWCSTEYFQQQGSVCGIEPK